MKPVRRFKPTCRTIAGLLAICVAAPLAAEAPVRAFGRMVAEPAYPTRLCATLPATIRSRNWSVDDVDADGVRTHPDHDRIQAAIDGCRGGAVKLVRGAHGEDGFLSSPLTLRSGVTLWVDKGVTLFASRDPRDYDTGDGFCGTATKERHRSCRAFINGRQLEDSGIVGEGSIDGRGGSRLLAGPNKGKSSWWDLAMLSKRGLSQNVFRLVALDGGSRLTLYRTTFENSPNFHVVPGNFRGVTAWGIRILSPSLEYSRRDYACPSATTPAETESATCFTPDTVKNTDGFDPSQSSEVLLAYSWISTGDDNVAIKAGGTVVSRDQVYAHNHFYYGHGMSIGSETNGGAEHILVTDLVMDGMDSPNGNGLRIKSDASRGGKVRDVVFEHVCMRNEARPMVFDTYYSDRPGNLLPDFQNIVVRDFHYQVGGRYGAGTAIFRGYAQPGTRLPLDIILDTIVFEGGVPSVSAGKGKDGPTAAHISLAGPNAFAGVLTASTADDVTVTTIPSTVTAPRTDCARAFVPLSSVMPDSPI
jgi:polygalacturonase